MSSLWCVVFEVWRRRGAAGEATRHRSVKPGRVHSPLQRVCCLQPTAGQDEIRPASALRVLIIAPHRLKLTLVSVRMCLCVVCEYVIDSNHELQGSLLPVHVTAVLLSASSLSFFSVITITHEPLDLAWWNFAWTCTLTSWRPLEPYWMSRSHGFLACMILLELVCLDSRNVIR